MSRPRSSLTGRIGGLASSCLALAAAALPALAQERADTAALPEIVVTATRYPVAPESLTATLTVLRGEELRAQGIRFVGEALRQVPGVQVVQGGSFGATTSLFMRGGESDHVKVLVDGVPVNQPGGAFDLASLTTDNVERIEVLRGPASVLYGSDAIAGVIQIITRQGSGPAQLNAEAEGGTFGTVRWQGSALGGGPDFGWSASVGRMTTDGAYDFNNDYRNTVASGLLRTRVGERTGVALSARHTDAKFHFPTDFTGAQVDHNQFSTERTTTLSLDLTHRIAQRAELQLLLGRTMKDLDITNPPDDETDPSPASTFSSTADRNSVELRALASGPAASKLLGGVSFDDQTEEGSSYPNSVRPNRDNWGFYAQAAVPVHARLNLVTGGRLDHNERFGDFWTYRVSALAVATASTRLRASVGSGFKEPSFFENYATGFVTGNPELDPERSVSVEGGVEQSVLGGGLALSVTGFAQWFRDLVQYNFTVPAGQPNYVNIAGANASGVEAGLEVRHVGPVQGGVTYTRLHTKVTDAGVESGANSEWVEGERLIRRPADAVTVRLTTAWTLPVRLGAVVTHIGSRDDIKYEGFTPGRVRLSPYTTLDLSGSVIVLRARPRVPQINLTGRVENVFDEDYEQVAGYPARGRTVLVGVSSSLR